MPTGTRVCNASPAVVMLKISKAPFGVFTANSLVPSGDMAMGRTWPLSNSTKEGPLDEPATEAGKKSAHVNTQTANNPRASAHFFIWMIGIRTRRMEELLSCFKLAPVFRAQETRRPMWPENTTGKKVYHKIID